ncbi:hypothetical protein [Clostridium sp. OS1-26]|uniref:hypothetical protein n=1 Tax=Clostridium sp. OS1-26 TaxID=3070681 RepID=UPI0027DF8328|nr:hypothetical protein [Clostridium sp. OS1-26]WML32950.1 hypothetical protein RCG18_16505 [Clostridium sp. OS1-26]
MKIENIELAYTKILYVFKNKIINYLKTLDAAQIDEVLKNRDCEIFSTQWTRVYNEVSKIKQKENLTEIYRKHDEKLRRNIFLEVYNITLSEDMASYVSDDFGLILDSLAFEYKDNWISSLWSQYIRGKMPQGELIPTDRTIEL